MMSISFQCPSCEKTYTAKQSSAGTEFRCKRCDATVTVPTPELESDVSAMDERPQETPLPPRRQRVAVPSSPVPKRAAPQPAGRTIPLTLIIVMLMECLLVAFNGFNLTVGISDNSANLGAIVVIVLRISFELAVVAGLWQGRHLARTAALWLSGLGLGMVAIYGGAKLLSGPAGAGKAATLVILGLQFVLLAAELVLLMTDSATDFCDR